jgi:hypothetical protein
MTTETARLLEQLRKVEALHRSTTFAGEREAAEHALAALRAKLDAAGVDWRRVPPARSPFDFDLGAWLRREEEWAGDREASRARLWEQLERMERMAEEARRVAAESAAPWADVQAKAARPRKPPTDAQLDAWAHLSLLQWTPEQKRKRVFRAGWRPATWNEWRAPSGELKTIGEAAFEVARARVVLRAQERERSRATP